MDRAKRLEMAVPSADLAVRLFTHLGGTNRQVSCKTILNTAPHKTRVTDFRLDDLPSTHTTGMDVDGVADE